MPELTLDQLRALYDARQHEKDAVIESRQPADPDPYVSELADPQDIQAVNFLRHVSGDPLLKDAVISARQEPGPEPYVSEPVDPDAIRAHNEQLKEDGFK